MPTATRVAEFQQQEEDEATPSFALPLNRRARIKGTWTMFYQTQQYDFVDGNYYELPVELFDTLRKSGNIYDTMA